MGCNKDAILTLPLPEPPVVAVEHGGGGTWPEVDPLASKADTSTAGARAAGRRKDSKKGRRKKSRELNVTPSASHTSSTTSTTHTTHRWVVVQEALMDDNRLAATPTDVVAGPLKPRGAIAV